MPITKEEVLHIAKLARIDLSEDDIKRYQNQLSDILEYVEQLQTLDTDGVKATAQITGLENILREDKIVNCDEKQREEILDQVPEVKANLVKVKSVL